MRPGALVALAALNGAACSSPPPPTPIEAFSGAAIDALCDWAVRCLHVPDRATCERLVDPRDFDTRRAADSIAAGRAAYDGDAATTCFAATSDAFCLTPAFSDPSCRQVFVGLVPEGGACTANRECQDDGRCEFESCPDQCCVGTCGPPAEPLPPPGDADFGEPCQNHSDCRPEAYCESDGRCTRYPDEEGERCLFGCARGDLFCDVHELVCKRYGAAGERCDPAGEAAPPCDPAWAVCDGVCRPRPGLGERCNDSDRLCVPGTLCDLEAGVCVGLEPHGEPCESSAQCRGECDLGAGVCAPYGSCAL